MTELHSFCIYRDYNIVLSFNVRVSCVMFCLHPKNRKFSVEYMQSCLCIDANDTTVRPLGKLLR